MQVDFEALDDPAYGTSSDPSTSFEKLTLKMKERRSETFRCNQVRPFREGRGAPCAPSLEQKPINRYFSETLDWVAAGDDIARLT